MVRDQLIARDITDRGVLQAIGKVPRHRFVPEALQDQAYEDYPLPIDLEQTISQPYTVGLMTSLLRLEPSNKILEIGTGSGYQAAVLAEICDRIFSIERIAELTRSARKVLDDLCYSNVALRTGDGYLGWPKYAPFDRILVSAATREFPSPLLLDQLSGDGILVAPLGTHRKQEIIRIHYEAGERVVERVCECRFVPLVRRFEFHHDR